MRYIAKTELTLTILALLLVVAAKAESRSKIPIPEFYGIYALERGNLVELKEMIRANVGEPRINIGEVTTEFSDKNLQFVFYGEVSTNILNAFSVERHEIVFICRKIRQNQMISYKQGQIINRPERVGISEKIRIRIKPIGNKRVREYNPGSRRCSGTN